MLHILTVNIEVHTKLVVGSVASVIIDSLLTSPNEGHKRVNVLKYTYIM